MQEPESSWKEYCSKKERDSAEFLGDMPRTAQVLTMAVVATEPVDKLSARLQHLDAHSDSLQGASARIVVTGPSYRRVSGVLFTCGEV